MWLLYMGHLISNYVFGLCNLYWFKLTCSATETWNLEIDNYEHLIYYLDNKNKRRPDRKAIIAENENPGTSTALPWSIRG